MMGATFLTIALFVIGVYALWFLNDLADWWNKRKK